MQPHQPTEYSFIHDIVKDYDNMFKVIKYHTPLMIRKNYDRVDKVIKVKIPDEDSIQRSVRRSKSIIRDYTLCNDFSLFATFTFNPKKVNRYDFIVCASKMQGWLLRTRQFANQQNIDFKYLIVPEFHKDGAIHFHALLANFPKNLKKSNVIQDNKMVYNIPSFTFGFTNVKKLDPQQIKDGAIYGYLTKYITKDMALVNGRKRYWSSKNLNKPITYHNKIIDFNLNSKLTDENLSFNNQYAEIYQIPKFE